MSTFHFLVVRKNKSMGNCISKVNKDPFIVYEELMKNEILFSKGKIRSVLEMGRIYAKAHSIMKFSEIMPLAPLQTGVWWRDICVAHPV